MQVTEQTPSLAELGEMSTGGWQTWNAVEIDDYFDAVVFADVPRPERLRPLGYFGLLVVERYSDGHENPIGRLEPDDDEQTWHVWGEPHSDKPPVWLGDRQQVHNGYDDVVRWWLLGGNGV